VKKECIPKDFTAVLGSGTCGASGPAGVLFNTSSASVHFSWSFTLIENI
jgi:hypothetical protein